MKNVIVFLFLVVFLSCKDKSVETESKQNNNDSVTTKKIIAEDKVKNFPLIFENAFKPGTIVNQDKFRFSFSKKDIGKIKLVSGKIMATDPITMNSAIAFVKKFPKGEFPVELSIASMNEMNLVAYVRINFSDEVLDHWEFAILPGQEQMGLIENQYYSFSVDAGTAMIADSVALSRIEYDTGLLSQEANFEGKIFTFGKYNLAGFTTGFGDGRYCVYIGYDEKRNVCRLLADFNVIEWWK